MGNLSDYAENKILDHLLKNTAFSQPGTLYLALCTADPGEAGTGSTLSEPSGGSYARKACNTWDAAAARASANATAVMFPQATAGWGTITHFAICDHLTTGNVLVYGAVTPSRAVLSGMIPKFAKGDVDVSVNAGAVSTALANGILDTLLKNTPIAQPSNLYLALAKSAPSDADDGGALVEPTGTGYARVSHNIWDAASGGASENTGAIAFPAAGSTWGTITHFALVNHATTGMIFFFGALTTARVITTGEYPNFPDGSLDLSID